jgi:uncharacterized RDD family membrane protein YckC
MAYAGFWLRFVAYCIDGLILGFVAICFLLPFGGVMAVLHASEDDIMRNPALVLATGFWGIVLVLAALFGHWLYCAGFESSAWQATPGKRALGLVVTDEQGRRISFGRATGRYLGKIVSSLILNIGFIMAGFTEKKQALHDIFVNCLVLKRR